MAQSSIGRRAFCATVGAAVLGACSSAAPGDESPREGLVRLLGFTGEEESWLEGLSATDERALYDALASPAAVPDKRAIDLLMRVLGRRERLFAYVGYPPLSNDLRACDGLLRE